MLVDSEQQQGLWRLILSVLENKYPWFKADHKSLSLIFLLA
jgi:hypothetical protein